MHWLSIPPQAVTKQSECKLEYEYKYISHLEGASIRASYKPTKFPDWAYATLITHADRNGMIWTLFPVHESQMINLPSSDPDTQCLQMKYAKYR